MFKNIFGKLPQLGEMERTIVELRKEVTALSAKYKNQSDSKSNAETFTRNTEEIAELKEELNTLKVEHQQALHGMRDQLEALKSQAESAAKNVELMEELRNNQTQQELWLNNLQNQLQFFKDQAAEAAALAAIKKPRKKKSESQTKESEEATRVPEGELAASSKLRLSRPGASKSKKTAKNTSNQE